MQRVPERVGGRCRTNGVVERERGIRRAKRAGGRGGVRQIHRQRGRGETRTLHRHALQEVRRAVGLHAHIHLELHPSTRRHAVRTIGVRLVERHLGKREVRHPQPLRPRRCRLHVLGRDRQPGARQRAARLLDAQDAADSRLRVRKFRAVERESDFPRLARRQNARQRVRERLPRRRGRFAVRFAEKQFGARHPVHGVDVGEDDRLLLLAVVTDGHLIDRALRSEVDAHTRHYVERTRPVAHLRARHKHHVAVIDVDRLVAEAVQGNKRRRSVVYPGNAIDGPVRDGRAPRQPIVQLHAPAQPQAEDVQRLGTVRFRRMPSDARRGGFTP